MPLHTLVRIEELSLSFTWLLLEEISSTPAGVGAHLTTFTPIAIIILFGPAFVSSDGLGLLSVHF